MNETLIDLTNPSVTRMLNFAKARGYVTRNEIDEVLPPDEFTSEQIEGVVKQLLNMSISIVEVGSEG